MKIVAVCGMGLGSSLMVEMNVEKCLKKLNIEYEVLTHLNLASFQGGDWDIVICGKDIDPSINFDASKKIVLENIVSEKELTDKLKAYFKV